MQTGEVNSLRKAERAGQIADFSVDHGRNLEVEGRRQLHPSFRIADRCL